MLFRSAVLRSPEAAGVALRTVAEMTRPDPDPTPRSWHQLLAAYADGELDTAECERLRNWLDENPDAYSRLEEQRSLSPGNAPFWDTIQPPSPDAIAWARTWNRIEAGLQPPMPATRPRFRGPWWRRGLAAVLVAVPGTAVAAAVVAACFPDRPAPVVVAPFEDSADDVFQVAAAGDVEILSIRDVDVPQLVVGEPPFVDPMMLAAAGDVRLEAMQPANDGMVPEVKMGGSDAPLIYAPPR